MIIRLAIRSLVTRPMRSAVLSIGFGLSIAVMAALLGVGEVILEQAHSPALAGGGDVVISGGIGPLDSARYVLTSVLGSPAIGSRVAAASPSRRGTLYLLSANASGPVTVHGGIPSREQAVGDPEIAGQTQWKDEGRDREWTNPEPGDLLRAMDRFHAAPAQSRGGEAVGDSRASGGAPGAAKPADAPASAGGWAEWLYFNARSADGAQRFYLTFMTGAPDAAGARPAYVRLQLNRGGATTNYSARGTVGDRDVLERAPDIDIAGNSVRLGSDGTYQIALDLRAENGVAALTGALTLKPAFGRSMPPAAIHGARGWLSGYVVPVLSGAFSGVLRSREGDIVVDGMAGYHDHNWGYWAGVRWQWGQVASGALSIVYGRVFPPADVADPSRVPGFLGVIGADGPIAFSTDVTIREDDDNGRPRTVTIESHGRRLDMTLHLDVAESVQTAMGLTRDASGAMTFLQLGGVYHVVGRAAGTDINFTARGSAETFRAAAR